MPNTHVPAAGEAMPAAKPRSFRPVVVGDVQMAAAALQIERDAAFIATALALIHGYDYRVHIDHASGFVLVARRS